MALIPLPADSFLFPGAVNSLLLAGDGGRALIVDSGLDESHARKLLRAMQEAGLTPAAILNTHSHADHHGGNRFILGRFPGLPVYAPPLEAAVITHPILEPLTLYGAMPPRELRGKFLLAPASPAQGVEAGVRTLGGVEVRLLEVPGHAGQMVAVQRGGLLYAADALFGPEALGRHPLTFCLDSRAQKESAASLRGLEGVELTVPGHGDPTLDLAGLVDLNLASLERITDGLLAAVREGPASPDELLARVCDALGTQMESAAAVVLNRSVVSAHLAELLELGRVGLRVQHNRMLFTLA